MMNDFLMHVNVNILPLGSYDLLIGMDWLEEHKVVLNCFDKTFTCTDNNENNIKIKETPRKVTIREIFALQMKRYVRKWCKVFIVYIMNDNETDNKPKLEEIPVLKEFEDISPEEVLGLPPKRYWLHNRSNTQSGTSIESSIPNEYNRTYRVEITTTRTNR